MNDQLVSFIENSFMAPLLKDKKINASFYTLPTFILH